MPVSTLEAREQILGDLAVATDHVALALACVSEAFEQLDVAGADRLEDELFRPLQRAYGRAKQTRNGFAERVALPAQEFESPSAGLSSQGVKLLLERAADAATEADLKIAALQDTMLPVDAGDAELRSGLGEIRELLAPVASSAKQFVRGFGR